jgi:methyl-accepting chemotaxis protein
MVQFSSQLSGQRRQRVKNFIKKIIGVILSLTAIVGIIFSIAALIMLWTYRPAVDNFATENMNAFRDTLDTTQAGLYLAESSLGSSIASITTLETTIAATAKSIDDTAPMIDTFVVLTGEDLPAAVSSAQLSLLAAQDSAKIIDGLLVALASIPFVPNDLYNPPVPLHVALGQVYNSVENLPVALQTMEDSLVSTGQNMEVIQTDINQMATDVHEISISMVEAQTVLNDYQDLVADLQFRLDRVDQHLDGWIQTTFWLLSFLLALLAVTQLGLLAQGIGYLN